MAALEYFDGLNWVTPSGGTGGSTTLSGAVTGSGSSSIVTSVNTAIVRLDTVGKPTSSVDMNNQSIVSLPYPSNNTDAASKVYVDSVISRLPCMEFMRGTLSVDTTTISQLGTGNHVQFDHISSQSSGNQVDLDTSTTYFPDQWAGRGVFTIPPSTIYPGYNARYKFTAIFQARNVSSVAPPVIAWQQRLNGVNTYISAEATIGPSGLCGVVVGFTSAIDCQVRLYIKEGQFNSIYGGTGDARRVIYFVERVV